MYLWAYKNAIFLQIKLGFDYLSNKHVIKRPTLLFDNICSIVEFTLKLPLKNMFFKHCGRCEIDKIVKFCGPLQLTIL